MLVAPIEPMLMVLAFTAITLAASLQARRTNDIAAWLAVAGFGFHTLTLLIRFGMYLVPVGGLDPNFQGARILSVFLYGVQPYVLFTAGGCLLLAMYREKGEKP